MLGVCSSHEHSGGHCQAQINLQKGEIVVETDACALGREEKIKKLEQRRKKKKFFGKGTKKRDPVPQKKQGKRGGKKKKDIPGVKLA